MEPKAFKPRQNKRRLSPDNSSVHGSESDLPIAKYDKKIFPCNYCKRTYSSPQALGGHQNAHKDLRAFAKGVGNLDVGPFVPRNNLHPYQHKGLFAPMLPHFSEYAPFPVPQKPLPSSVNGMTFNKIPIIYDGVFVDYINNHNFGVQMSNSGGGGGYADVARCGYYADGTRGVGGLGGGGGGNGGLGGAVGGGLGEGYGMFGGAGCSGGLCGGAGGGFGKGYESFSGVGGGGGLSRGNCTDGFAGGNGGLGSCSGSGVGGRLGKGGAIGGGAGGGFRKGEGVGGRVGGGAGSGDGYGGVARGKNLIDLNLKIEEDDIAS